MKYSKSIIIFFSALIFYESNSFATDYYFNFKPAQRIPNSKNEYKVNFLFLSQGNFIVRPIIDNPQGQIFIKKGEIWVAGNENWILLPHLEKTMIIKIQNVNEKTQIYFQIQNSKTGKVYGTPVKYLWPRKIVNEYFNRLNAKIL